MFVPIVLPEMKKLEGGRSSFGSQFEGSASIVEGKEREQEQKAAAMLSSRRRADKIWSRAVHPQGSAPPREASSVKAPPPKDSTIVQNGASSWGAHVQTQKLMGVHFIFTQPLFLRKTKANQTSEPFVLEPESLHVFQSLKRCPHG